MTMGGPGKVSKGGVLGSLQTPQNVRCWLRAYQSALAGSLFIAKHVVADGQKHQYLQVLLALPRDLHAVHTSDGDGRVFVVEMKTGYAGHQE